MTLPDLPDIPTIIPPPRFPWALFAALGIPMIIMVAVIVGMVISNTQITTANTDRITQLESGKEAGDRIIYLSRLGALKWMRACAYASALDKKSVAEMNRDCGLDLGIKTFSGDKVL